MTGRRTSKQRRAWLSVTLTVLLLQALSPPGYMAAPLSVGRDGPAWPVMLCPDGLPEAWLSSLTGPGRGHAHHGAGGGHEGHHALGGSASKATGHTSHGSASSCPFAGALDHPLAAIAPPAAAKLSVPGLIQRVEMAPPPRIARVYGVLSRAPPRLSTATS